MRTKDGQKMVVGIWFPFRDIVNIPLLQFSFTVYLSLKFSFIISGCQNMSRNGTKDIHDFIYLLKYYLHEACN
jgi:hypothetical protein